MPAAFRRHLAFTVLELIVAMTVVGIVAAVSIPKISAINTQNKVQRAANMMQVEVQQAFALAGRNRKPIKFNWNSATLQLQVTDRLGTTIYRKTGLGVGSSLNLEASEVTVFPTTVTVFPNGLASDTLFMRVTKGAFTKTVRVSKSGMTRIQ